MTSIASTSNQTASVPPSAVSTMPTNHAAANTTTGTAQAPPELFSTASQQQRRRRTRKKKPPATTGSGTIEATNARAPCNAGVPSSLADTAATSSAAATTTLSKNQIRNAKRKNQQRKKKEQEHREEQRKHNWWRNQVPEDSVDPITLESLQSLHYPPFALVASPPYIPIDWPLSKIDPDEGNSGNELTEEERQRQILEAQWGTSLRIDDNVTTDDTKRTTTDTEITKRQSQRHMNLFDGRALAYYMVSQLQFIDPLNRRDITRDELIHLDHYLRRHKFFELNVVEAYDTKGVTLSSAGATANTAMGRSMILQQEAQTLLNALFGGNTISRSLPVPTSNPNNRNSLMEQYEAHESTHHRQSQPHSTTVTRQQRNNQISHNVLNDTGMIIIDDDETPGLRGNAQPFYSANHIAARYGNNNNNIPPPVSVNDFPSLATTVHPAVTQEQIMVPAVLAPKSLPKTKTLAKISKMVKETNPEEQQRQWEAREAARRKAMLANLTFGSNPSYPNTSEAEQLLSGGIPSQITTVNGPTVAQIERNRAFAEALGVQPATVRPTALGGWMRPTEHAIVHDEFGNELSCTVYPDILMKKAKAMRLDIILKLEKKWKLFLMDDRAASLPLYPMEKSIRAFVHEYAEYWQLHTESFDPEPKRYVHCVKLRDTCAPYPLLSDAMKVWQNRSLEMSRIATEILYSTDHSINQTAGQSSEQQQQQREFPHDVNHQRVPLSLKPRSMPHGTAVSLSSGTPMGGFPSRSTMMTHQGSDLAIGGRFVSLTDGRERPKLDLQKRTLPLELEPYNSTNTAVAAVDLNAVHVQQMERQQRKFHEQQEKAQRKQRALQSAFASDDEKSDDSDSEWEEKIAVYHSSSDDEDDL